MPPSAALTCAGASGPDPGGPAGLVRRAVLRLMLPFTYHEREVDRSLVAAVRELGSELGAERARGLRDRARLRRVEAALETQTAAPLPGPPPVVHRGD